MQRYRPLCLYWGGSVHPNGLLTVTKPLLLKVMLSLIWLELSIQIFFLRNNILKSSTSLSPTRSPTSSSALCSIVQCSIVHCWTKRSLETLFVAPSAWKSYWPSLSSLFASDAMYLSKFKKNICPNSTNLSAEECDFWFMKESCPCSSVPTLDIHSFIGLNYI